MQINRILIQYGELTLKGRNRRDFERALRANVARRLQCAGLEDWPVHAVHGRTCVDVPAGAQGRVDDALAALAQVAGIATISPTVFIPAAATGQLTGKPDLSPVREAIVGFARATETPGKSFAVRANRGDKRVPIKSSDLARELGSEIWVNTQWKQVDLSHPDRSFYVDLYEEGSYVYTDRRRGMGGLPVHTAGRVLSLLSGGIDSPVAAWMLAKRGCDVDFLHLTATRVQQTRAEDELVARIARQLSQYTARSKLHLVPYTHFDLALMGSQTGYDVVLFRRFLARVGQHLATRSRAQALVSGDSLGQVASQTLENLVSTSRAVDMPFLRPLIGMDKQEIIDVAKRIGTYELSIEPYKDCCALLAENPRTRSYHDVLARIEAQYGLDQPELIERSLEEMVVLEFEGGQRVD